MLDVKKKRRRLRRLFFFGNIRITRVKTRHDLVYFVKFVRTADAQHKPAFVVETDPLCAVSHLQVIVSHGADDVARGRQKLVVLVVIHVRTPS